MDRREFLTGAVGVEDGLGYPSPASEYKYRQHDQNHSTNQITFSLYCHALFFIKNLLRLKRRRILPSNCCSSKNILVV